MKDHNNMPDKNLRNNDLSHNMPKADSPEVDGQHQKDPRYQGPTSRGKKRGKDHQPTAHAEEAPPRPGEAPWLQDVEAHLTAAHLLKAPLPESLKPVQQLADDKLADLDDDEQPMSLGEVFGHALYSGIVKDVTLLVAISPSLLNLLDSEGWTPLHCAAANGHLDLVKWLLEHGAKPGQGDKKGRLPLYYAAQNARSAVCCHLVEIMMAEEGCAPGTGVAETFGQLADDIEVEGCWELYQSGYNVGAKDEHGATALHYAAQSSDEGRVHTLLIWGAETNIQDKNGDTPLHLAVSGMGEGLHGKGQRRRGRNRTVEVRTLERPGAWRSVIRQLIEADADTLLCNNKGYRAYDIAKATHQYEVMDWIGIW